MITLTNSSAGIARNVTGNDTLPSNPGTSWSIDAADSASGAPITAGALASGPHNLAPRPSVHTLSLHDALPICCGTVDNTATVSTSNDGSGQDEASVVVNCGQISISKLADAATVSAGDQIGFTITLTNSGAEIGRAACR